MKIVKKGNVSFIYRGKCDSCRTVVECKEKELQTIDDRGETFQKVNCPSCGHWIYPSKKRVKKS